MATNDVHLSIDETPTFVVGTRIEAKYRGQSRQYFSGVISKVNDDRTFDINYDDGDKEQSAKAEHIRLPEPTPKFKASTRVLAKIYEKTGYFPGTVMRVDPTKRIYRILFDNGHDENGVKEEDIQLHTETSSEMRFPDIVSSYKHPAHISMSSDADSQSPASSRHSTPPPSPDGASRLRRARSGLYMPRTFASPSTQPKGRVYVPPVRRPPNDSEDEPKGRVYIPPVHGTPSETSSVSHNSEHPSLSNRLTFRQVSEILNTSYNYEQAIQSTTLDIIAVYLKGQKVLYTEAKTYCEMNLYMLMLPTIAFSALCTLLSTQLKDTSYGGVLVASITAVNSFLLSIVTYLKLDGKAEAHRTSAYSFEKLQTRCEFNSGKVLFLSQGSPSPDAQATVATGHVGNQSFSTAKGDDNPGAKPVVVHQNFFSPSEIVKEIESKIMEIKDTNNFLLPEAIRYRYPKLSGTNIFTEFKRIQIKEIMLINALKVVINKQQELDQRLTMTHNKEKHEQLQKQQEELSVEQNRIFDTVIRYREEYLQIDRDFKDEMQYNINHWSNKFCICCRWLKT